MMYLTHLTIGSSWDDNPATEGKAVFKNKADKSEVQVRLNEEQVQAILALCAEGIMQAAREASQAIVAKTIEAAATTTKQIEG